MNIWIKTTETFTLYHFGIHSTRVDQKVLKLVEYLLKYTTELHQTYTEYVTTIYLICKFCQNEAVCSKVH